MSITVNDIRYRAKCIKCNSPLGDWALHVPKRDRVCTACSLRDMNEGFGYKATKNSFLGKR
jgi:hypothetical protein